MPYGTPFTDEERRLRHLAKYGTLENFPTERRGLGTFWKEGSTFKKVALIGLGILAIYLLFKK